MTVAAPFKLTKAEALALVSVLERRVGYDQLLTVLVAAIGSQRAFALVEEKAGRITKAETVTLVKAILPLIPGANLKDKVKSAIAGLREAIPDKARADAILADVLERIKAYRNPPVVAPVADDGFLRFYGRVNMWCAGGNDALRKDIEVCASCGVGYQIEMAGWGNGQTAFDGTDMLTAAMTMYRQLHGWCKAAGIPLFVSISNWNITISKYGNKGRPFASIVPAAKKLAQAVLECGGKEWVYVQPVAETGKGDSAAVAFEKWCGNLFAGWKLVYNGGSRPSKPAYGWPLFAYHPNAATDGGKPGGISISDTGAIIKQLSGNGTLDGPGDPVKIATWFSNCKASGAVGAGYYGFQRGTHDPFAIRACAAPQAGLSATTDGAISPAQVRWLGTDYAKAKTTVTLSSVSMSGKHLNFKASAISWPPQGSKKGKAIGFLIRKIGGQYVGGKVEWCVVERGWYDIATNTATGYNGATMPKNGETCWAGLGHPTHGGECSMLLPFSWRL